jgi:predicted CopG family antitoxin
MFGTSDKHKRLKLIAVTFENYQSLKELGMTGDSFNDVVTKLLKERSNSCYRP